VTFVTERTALEAAGQLQPAGTEVEGKEGPRAQSAPLGGLPGIYERHKVWEQRKLDRLHELRLEKEEQESAQATKKAVLPISSRWKQVESVLRRERRADEDTKVGIAQRQAEEERAARKTAEAAAREAEAAQRQAEERAAASQVAQRQAEAVAREARVHMMAAQRMYEEEKQRADQAVASRADAEEVAEAFGREGLAVWPTFPGKKVWRLDTYVFDGRVSAEYRVKDAGSNERGVSLLMGRVAGTQSTQAQCVLFDSKLLSDVECARWWEANRYRFETKQKMSIAARDMLKSRSGSAGSARS